MTLPLNIETPLAGEVPPLPPASAHNLPRNGTAGQDESGPGRAAGEDGNAQPTLVIVVRGVPAPQGSKRGYVVKGRPVLVESSKKVKPWREAVKHAALDVMTAEPLAGPLMVSVVYTLPRPKSHYRTGKHAHLLRDGAPNWPAGKPDVGKLTRATEDALTDAGLWRDDAQVVASVSIKTYPGVHPRALTTPGAHIRIAPMPTGDLS